MPRGEGHSYYTAVLCPNGHSTTSILELSPERDQPHCSECGQATIRACPSCGAAIHGSPANSVVWSYDPPKYCHACGAPYPWTAAALEAGTELAQILEGLSAAERQSLVASFDDLTRDTPRTAVAVLRTKTLLGRLTREGATALRQVLVAVATDEVKRQMGL
jgi:hypothetical protein